MSLASLLLSLHIILLDRVFISRNILQFHKDVSLRFALKRAFRAHYFQSGIGGGGFATVRGVNGSIVVVDFRETAPAAAFEVSIIESYGSKGGH